MERPDHTLSDRVKTLLLIIEDNGQFTNITPEVSFRILSDKNYDLAKQYLIKEEPEIYDEDTFSGLKNCALDALEAI